jgi:HEAT repeat protein
LLAAATVEIKVDLVRRLVRELELGGQPALVRRQRLTLLESLLRDADWFVVTNAATALGELADASSLGALLDALVLTRNAHSRRALIAGLAAYGHQDAVPLLTEALSDPEPEVRLAALEALDALDPEDLLVRVAPLARDKAAWVRQRHDSVLARKGRR